MNNVLSFMGQDHDRLDGIFQQFKGSETGDPYTLRPLFHEFKTGLQRHIVWEEDILFPLFEEKMGMHDDGPTAVMRQEHRQIKSYMEQIHDALGREPWDSIRGISDSLTRVLTDHNTKEESILYPWIDEALDEKEREQVFLRMKSVTPDRYNTCCCH